MDTPNSKTHSMPLHCKAEVRMPTQNISGSTRQTMTQTLECHGGYASLIYASSHMKGKMLMSYHGSTAVVQCAQTPEDSGCTVTVSC
jgi:hypothetical protein